MQPSKHPNAISFSQQTDETRLGPEWQTMRRILAIRLDNIGDAIMLGPALRAIKEALPEARLTLLASPAGSLAAPMLPWVDDVLAWRAVWQEIGPKTCPRSHRSRNPPGKMGRHKPGIRL